MRGALVILPLALIAQTFNPDTFVGARSRYWAFQKVERPALGSIDAFIAEGLKKVCARTLVIGITSDLLFPPSEQKFLAEHIQGALYSEIDSLYGHDGFLIETEVLTKIISVFLTEDGATEPVSLHKTA